MYPGFFSQIVAEKIGYYVYLYIDPRDNTIFYVGKGKGNRVFAHLYDVTESRKVQRIAAIRATGLEPKIEILVHGLQDEQTALRIEASIIDLIGLSQLTNRVRGYDSTILGRMELKELVSHYDRNPIQVEHRVILIRINQLYRYGMSEIALYEATRGVWKIGSRRQNAEFAFAVFRGIVREVYKITSWHPAGTTSYATRPQEHLTDKERWEFVGERANEEIRNRYIDKSVEAYLAPNSQNPIRYVNC
jgi:hypothetical protein